MQAKTAMTNKQLKEMTETVKDLARVNSDSFKTITDVVTILTERYGYLGKETKTAAQAVLDFAKITGSDAVSAANALSVVMRAFNIPATKMYQVTDTLIAAQQRFGVQSAELIELLKNNAAPLKMLNLSFSEAVGLLAALESNGVNVARVLMGLRSAAAKGIDIKKALRELAEIREATERTRRATEIFGSYAGPGLARVLEGGTQALDKFMLKIEDVEGTTKRASATIDRSLSEQIGILKNNLTILAVEIGGSLLPVMKGMVKVIKSIADSFESLPAPIKGAIGVMAGFTTIAASVVGPLMLQAAAFAYFIKTIRDFGGLQGLFMTLSGSITEFAASAFSALAPLLPIILAISAAILVLQHAWVHNWFGIRDATAKAIEGIKSAFSVISSAIKTFISGFIEPIKILFAPLLETLGLFNKEAKKSSLLVQVVDAITGAFKWLYSVLKPHIPLIKQIIKIVGTLAAVLFLATNPIGQAILAITGLAWVFNKLRSVAGPVINRLRQGFEWLAKSIKGAIYWSQQAIDKMGPLKYLLLGPVGGIVYLITHFDKLRQSITSVPDAIGRFLGKLGPLKYILLGPVGSIILLVRNLSRLKSATSSALMAIKSLWDRTIGLIIKKINEFITKIKQAWNFMAKSPIGKLGSFMFNPVGAIMQAVKIIQPKIKPVIEKPEMDKRFYEEGSVVLKVKTPKIKPEIERPELTWLEELYTGVQDILRSVKLSKLSELIAKVSFLVDRVPLPEISPLFVPVKFLLDELPKIPNLAVKYVPDVIKPEIPADLTKIVPTPSQLVSSTSHPAAINTYHIRHEHKTINVPKIEIRVEGVRDTEKVAELVIRKIRREFDSIGIY